MKPHRVRMTHNLLLHYGIYKEMEVSPRALRPPPPGRTPESRIPNPKTRNTRGTGSVLTYSRERRALHRRLTQAIRGSFPKSIIPRAHLLFILKRTRQTNLSFF
jgi:hypothetical protein